MNNSQKPKTLKIVILGDSGVGKTCLLNRYTSGKFTGQYKATIGADFVSRSVVVTDTFGRRHAVTLQLWDTAGQERFQSLGKGFYRGADAALLCYDLTDVASLNHLGRWRQEFMDQVLCNSGGVGGGAFAGGLDGSETQFPFVVVGNKMDKTKDRAVPLHRALEWCRDAGSGTAGNAMMGGNGMPLPHLEASAKTSLNVDIVFEEIARRALQYEDYKQRNKPPQLFVPPSVPPLDLRGDSANNMNDPRRGGQNPGGCC